MKKTSKKRWTEQEIGIVIGNFDSSLSAGKNTQKLSPLLQNRTLEAIKRELYDFDNEGIIKLKKRKRKVH